MSYEQYRPTSFRILPAVVKNLLIINGLFFLAKIVLQNQYHVDLSDTLGLHFFMSEKFRIYQLITYMFMHENFMHLFFNMFALWMFGNVLENYWGAKRFIIYYLICGIGAASIHFAVIYFEYVRPMLNNINAFPGFQSRDQFVAFFNSLQPIPFSDQMQFIADNINGHLSQVNISALSIDLLNQYSVQFYNTIPVVIGASGSVFGILLAFGMLFPNTLLYVYFAIPIKAKWFVILYGGIELFSGIANNPADNVAHFAHLGGMLFGFILIKFWQRKRKIH